MMKGISGLTLALFAMMMTTTVVEGGVLDTFFGSDEMDENDPTKVKVKFPEGAGWFMDEREFELGAKGFGCLQDLAGVENDNNWGQSLIRPISRVMLSAYGKEGIATLCGSQVLARMRKARLGDNRKNRRQQRNLRQQEQEAAENPHHLDTTNNVTMPDRIRRRTQQQGYCSSWPASYGAGTGVYDAFARDHLEQYLTTNGGDKMTQRTDPVKTFSLQDQAATTRQAMTALNRCSRIWGTANQWLAVIDVPGVDQAAISDALKSFVCDLPATYTQIAMYRIQRDQELVDFHDDLVNSAEQGAMYRDTRTLMRQVCQDQAITAQVMQDIADIKDEIRRL